MTSVETETLIRTCRFHLEPEILDEGVGQGRTVFQEVDSDLNVVHAHNAASDPGAAESLRAVAEQDPLAQGCQSGRAHQHERTGADSNHIESHAKSAPQRKKLTTDCATYSTSSSDNWAWIGRERV